MLDFIANGFFWLIGFMGEAAFWGSVGMLVGWNVLPQPVLVKKYYDKAVGFVKSKM